MKRCFLLLALVAPCFAADDVILQAMRDELKRSMTLKMQNLETPYYIEYALDDGQTWTAVSTLGGLISSNQSAFRFPRVTVRIGDYKFDNTNYVGSGFHFGGRYDVERFPLENSYAVLRRYLWLETDQSYKSALEAISRKRAALKSISVIDQLPDLSPAPATQLLQEPKIAHIDFDSWIARTRSLSGEFARYPRIKGSNVLFNAVSSTHYYLTSEGTELRIPQTTSWITIGAVAQASDGMTLRDSTVFQSLDPARLPGDPEMQRAVKTVAERVAALALAPVGENYSGPVLFEGTAGAQVFAEILGKNLTLTRKPVTEPGNPASIQSSELEGRNGARVLPEFFDVVDDPTQSEFHGHPLFGSYITDEEGLKPAPLPIVEKGVLKNFLLTRQPVRGYSASNGRARLAGNFGANSAAISNLFVSARETMPLSEMKKQMLDLCQQRGKDYGIIVRKMDYPSSASIEEARRLLSGASQAGGGRPVSLPLLVYRLYKDGHEELVRGLRFRGFNARSLKDILHAGDDTNLFEFLDNGAPFALTAAGSSAAESCVVAPSILIDDLELFKMEDEQPKLPIVPPPALVSALPSS